MLAEAGQVVAEGQPVLRLANPAERELVVQVPEGALAAVEAFSVMAAFWTRPEDTAPARLRELSPQSDPLPRNYVARFSLPDAPAWIRPGMTGTVRMAAAAEPALSVPASAVLSARISGCPRLGDRRSRRDRG